MLRILVAELGGHAQLHWKAVFRWEYLAVVSQRKQSLCMQCSGHVNTGPVVVRTVQRHVLRCDVGARTLQEIGEAHAAPSADRTPSFYADMTCDLAFLRHSA